MPLLAQKRKPEVYILPTFFLSILYTSGVKYKKITPFELKNTPKSPPKTPTQATKKRAQAHTHTLSKEKYCKTQFQNNYKIVVNEMKNH